MKKRYEILATARDKQGAFLSSATNSYIKSHPLQKHFAQLAGQPNKIYLHAEIYALIRIQEHRANKIHSITIERYDENHRMQDAKPCPICIEATKAFGIKKINYTTKEGWVYGKTPESLAAN